MKIDREAFLAVLESVAPGTVTRESVDQSSCVVFTAEGDVVTFNDQTACRYHWPHLGMLTGAVPCNPLLELLRRLPEETIDVGTDGKALLIKGGKARRAKIIMEQEIILPIGLVEYPADGDWADLPPTFGEAVQVVGSCAAGPKADRVDLQCIHVHPDYLEACDNFQLCRYPMPGGSGVQEACLVRKTSLACVAGLGMTQVADTGSWLHTRNEAGLTVSFRRESATDYRDLTPFYEIADGQPATLPGGLAETVDKAEVFADDSSKAQVLVKLSQGRFQLSGAGNYGSYEERKMVQYGGPDLSFMIDPKLLVKIAEKSANCLIGAGRMRVDGGAFTYVTCLGAV